MKWAHVYHQEDLGRIVDCEEPDKMTAEERRAARMQAEEEKFDEDHYMYGSMALMGEGWRMVVFDLSLEIR